MWSLGAGLFLHVVRGDGKCLNTPRRAQTHTHSLAKELITWNLVRRDFQSLFYYFYVILKSFISHLHPRPKFTISDISFHFFLSFPPFLLISSSCLFLCYFKKIPLIQSRPRWFSIALWYVTRGGQLNSSLQCLILYTPLKCMITSHINITGPFHWCIVRVKTICPSYLWQN